MKKLMIAAAIVCAAAFAQASTYKWQAYADGVYDSSAASEGGVLKSGLATFFFDANVTDAGELAAQLAQGKFDDLFTEKIGDTLGIDYGGWNVYGPSANITGNGDPTAVPAVPDTAVSAFAVIFDNKDADKAGNFWISDAADGVVDGTVQDGGYAQIVFGELNTASTATGWQTITTAAPEPTSGLLLLLGVAGLALRRRRA